MTDDLPVFELAKLGQSSDGYLFRGGELFPLARVCSTPAGNHVPSSIAPIVRAVESASRAIEGGVARTIGAVESASRAAADGRRVAVNPDDFPHVAAAAPLAQLRRKVR